MKPKYSLRLVSSLLLTAMLLTSCTRETLQSPQESQVAGSLNGQTINSNAQAASLLLKAPRTYPESGNLPIQLIGHFTISVMVIGNNQEIPSLELYSAVGENTPTFLSSVKGCKCGSNSVARLVYQSSFLEVKLYARVSGKSGWVGWVNLTPKVFTQSTQLIMSGCSQTVVFGFQWT